ncbi:MAG: endonuclease [Eubacterium sp.]|nr:endonuclease [Eubacterium sp.]
MRKKIFKIILFIIIIIVAAVAALLITLIATEYKPADTETTDITGTASSTLKTGESLQVLSWNLGYCGLSSEADFFLDGGESVRPVTKDGVQENLSSISDYIASSGADLVALQEVDVDSKRSYHIDENAAIADTLSGYQNTFATNYKVFYVPYPVPTVGSVHAGLSSYSQYEITDTLRTSLNNASSSLWRLFYMKRCLLSSRIPIEGTDQELVFINLHLEAYSEGDGQAKQTKQLLELMQSEYDKGNYVIACGDFNQTFSNADTSNYPLQSDTAWEAGILDVEDFGENFTAIMDTDVPSCRSLEYAYDGSEDFQFYVIDGFIVSDNVTIKSCKTDDLDFRWSDHNPTTLEVTLNP